MARNPEASAAAKLYRSFVPAHVRHRIDARVSIEHRARIKSMLALLTVSSIVGRVRHVAHKVTHPAFHQHPQTSVVADGRVRRVALVVKESLTPLAARCRNLEAVRSALDAASIPYFAVRGVDDRVAVLGVDDVHSARVRKALSAYLRETAGYYSLIHQEQNSALTKLQPGTTPVVWSPTAHIAAVRAVWFYTDPAGRLVLGASYGCEVEFWRRDGQGALIAPRRNRVTEAVSVDEPQVELSDTLFTRLAPADRDPLPTVPSLPSFAHARPDDVTFPVDIVFTWVDGADERWQRRRAAAHEVAYHEESDNDSRYLSRDELKYALRSIEMFAPWVRRVFIVTDDQVPAWLDTRSGVEVVDHRQIFSDVAVLPTFNSHAIESQLHHIEGLAEHFIYFNDDMMLGREVTPQHFFHANGISQFFPSPATVPQGPAQPTDVPVTIAAKNNRALLQQRFGSNLTQKMKHAPYALRRSVLAEIEQEFAAEHARTMASRVRSSTDLSIVSSLHHYFAFHTGRAVPGRIRYRYVDLGKPDAARLLGVIKAGRTDEAICLNTTTVTGHELPLEQIVEFFESYFPLPSRFER